MTEIIIQFYKDKNKDQTMNTTHNVQRPRLYQHRELRLRPIPGKDEDNDLEQSETHQDQNKTFPNTYYCYPALLH